MRQLAAYVLDPIVVRERDVEFLRLADAHPDQLFLPARDHASLADDQGEPVRRASLERLAVDRPRELDSGDVAVLGRSSVDGS